MTFEPGINEQTATPLQDPSDPQAEEKRRLRREEFRAAAAKLSQEQQGAAEQADGDNPEVDNGGSKRNLLLDTLLGAVRGPLEAANETAKSAQALDDWFVGLPGIRQLKAGVDRITPSFIRRLDNDAKDHVRDTGVLDNFIPEPERGLGMFAEGLTQFATDFVGFGKVFKAARLLQSGTRAANFTSAFTRGAIADATAFDPFEARLSNMFTEIGPEATRAAAEWFAADADDTQGEARLKAALEGAVLGGVLDGLMLTFRAFKNINQVRKGGLKGDAADAAMRSADEDLEQAESLIRDGDPADPIKVREQDDGTWAVVHEPESGAFQPGPHGRSIDRTAIESASPEAQEVFRKLEEVSGSEHVGSLFGDPEDLAVNLELDSVSDAVFQEVRSLVTSLSQEGLPETIRVFRGGTVKPGSPAIPVSTDRKIAASFGEVTEHIVRREDVLADPEFFSLSSVKGGESELLVTADALTRPAGAVPMPGRKFKTRGAAESQAASVRIAVREASRSVEEGLTTEQVGQVKAIADVLRDSSDAEEVLARATDGTLNLGYSHTPESAKRQIIAIAEAMPKEFEKIPTSNESTLAFAKDLLAGTSEAETASIMGATFQAVDNLPQIMVASRIWLWNQGRNVAKLSKMVDMNAGDDIAATELEKALRSLFDTQRHVFGMARRVGQALQSQQIVVKGTEAKPRAGTRRGLNVIPQEGSEQISEVFENMSANDIRAMARRIRMADGDPNQILTMVEASKRMADAKRLKKPGIIDKIVEWRINSMLSGVATHVVNTASTAANTVARPAEMAWAGLHLRNPELRRKAMQEAGDTMVGLTMAMRDSWGAAVKAMKMGENVLDPGHMIDDRGRASHAITTNWLGTIIRAPTRLMLSTDEFFKQLNYRAQIRAKSFQLSRADGIADPRAMAERLDADMRAAFNPDGTATLAPAREYAREVTFTNTLTGPVGKMLTNAAAEMPAIRLVLPFIRTPMNLFRYTWERTPGLNLAMKSVREDLAAGGVRRAQALARAEFGATAYALGAVAFANGMITGRAPQDPELRNVWMQTHQPYSIRIGNRWVSYRRMDPFATPVGLIADAAQFAGEFNQDSKLDPGEMAATVIGAITSNVGSKTFLKTTVETLEALVSGDPHKLERIFRIQSRPMFPFSGLLGGANREVDPVMRETRTYLDDVVRQHIPGMSDTLEPKRNFWGEKIMRGPFGGRAVNPFTVSRAIPADEEEMTMELLSLGKGIPLPGTTKLNGELDLTDRVKWSPDGKRGQSPYDHMMALMDTPLINGKTAKEAVFDLMRSPTWDTLSPGTATRGIGGTRHMLVSQILDSYQNMAWFQTMEKYPELQAAFFEGNALERAAQSEGQAGVDRIKNMNLFESLRNR